MARRYLFGVSLLALACSDAGLKVHNASPSASITSPFDGQVVTRGQTLTLTGLASDIDDVETALQVTWYVGAREACAAAAPAADGTTECETALDADTVRLEVRDPSGAVDVAGVSLVIEAPVVDTGMPPDDTGNPEDTGAPEDTGDPPEDLPLACAITAPVDGSTADPYVDVAWSGSVLDPDSSTTGTTARWESDLDGVLSEAPPASDGTTEGAGRLSPGSHTLTLAGTDDLGQSCSDAVQFTVPDRCPGLQVDGTGTQYASVAGHTDFTATATTLTASAWVRWDGATGQAFHPIVSQGWGDDATARFFLAVVGSGGFSACSGPDEAGQAHFELKVDGANVCLASDRPLPVGQWTHVSASFDAGTAMLHINGTLDASASFAGANLTAVSPGDLLLGASPTEGGLGFGGLLGGIHVSSLPQSAADFTPAWPPVTDAGTLGLWRLDDHEPTVEDAGAGAHVGTVVGGVWLPDCPDADADGDGFEAWQDCDETDAGIYPWAGDTLGDGVDSDCDGLDCEATEVSGIYWAVCNEPGSWPAVRDTCQDAGYDDLAVFDPLSEATTAQTILQTLGVACVANSHACPWIGLYHNGSTWIWADGTAVTDTDWSPGEPTGDGSCVHMDRYGSGRWNDAPCEDPGASFGMVCERSMVP